MKAQIDEYLKNILQRDVKFILNEKKVLRKGKLMLYSIKDYYVTFIISTPKCPKKVYEVYYPYEIRDEKDNKQVVFDYTLDTLTNNNVIYNNTLYNVAKKFNTHIFFDNQLRITYE